MTHITIVSMSLGALFLLSAIAKWSDFTWFRKTLGAYKIVPIRLVPVVTVLIMATETVVALMLLLGLEEPVAGYASALMLVAFSGAIAVNLLRGHTSINCGCGPKYGEDKISWFLVIRNVCLIVLSLVSTGLFATDRSMSLTLSISAGLGVVLAIWLHRGSLLPSRDTLKPQKTIA